MNLRHLFYVGAIALTATIFAAGCSVRVVPLDEPVEERQVPYHVPVGSYYNGESGYPPPAFSDEVWRMSQYYRYTDEFRYSGYLPDPTRPPDRMNIDPNPTDRYQVGEPPLRRAPTHQATQPGAGRSVEGRQDPVSSQRPRDRRRYISPTPRRETEHDVRQRLKQRGNRKDDRSKEDEARQEQRRNVRRRVQR
jgi:hypothetical protein